MELDSDGTKAVIVKQELREEVEFEEEKDKDIYYSVTTAIGKLIQGYSNLAIVKGQPGIGKSFNIRRILKEQSAEFVELSGEHTAAYLYRTLYENNGQIIWFKDLSKLLSDVRSLNLLKAANETEQIRKVTKSNYSSKQVDLPNAFIWTGKMIFDYNTLAGVSKKTREDFDALVSRGSYVELVFSKEDIIKEMYAIANTGWKKEVTKHLIENYKYNGKNPLNLRTQQHAFSTYLYAEEKELNWKEELLRDMVNETKDQMEIYKLIGNNAVKLPELKKLLVLSEVVGSLSTARRKVKDMIEMGELVLTYISAREYAVSLPPK